MYNFDEIIDRKGTNALNTDGFRGYIFHAGPEKKFPYKDDEFIRMWVADMEFGVAPEILDELHKRVDRRMIMGTTILSKSGAKTIMDMRFHRKNFALRQGLFLHYINWRKSYAVQMRKSFSIHPPTATSFTLPNTLQ